MQCWWLDACELLVDLQLYLEFQIHKTKVLRKADF